MRVVLVLPCGQGFAVYFGFNPILCKAVLLPGLSKYRGVPRSMGIGSNAMSASSEARQRAPETCKMEENQERVAL